MNKYKELRLLEELMVELIDKDEDSSEYYLQLEEAQLKLLEQLEIE